MTRQIKTREDYYALTAELAAIEAKTKMYITDECIDAENCGKAWNEDGYYNAMFEAACMSAGIRAEEAGFDINDLIGRDIY